MKVFFAFLISLAGLFALNNLLPEIYRAAAPNFLFLLVVFYALRKDSLGFLWLAFFAGLILDLFSGNFFGGSALALLAVSALLAYATSAWFTAELSVELTSILIVCAYLAYVLILFMINSAAAAVHLVNFPISAQIFEVKVWLDLVLNLIFAAPIYYLTLFLDRVTAVKPKF